MKSLNSTDDHLPSTEFTISVIVFGSFCTVLGTLGNLSVIIFNVCMNHSKTPSTYFVVNLAISDILVCATFFPIWIVELARTVGGRESNQSLFCKLALAIPWTSMAMSVINILAITVDRYIFILRPLKYPMLITWPRTYVVSLLTWLLLITNSSTLAIYTKKSTKRLYCEYNLTVLTPFMTLNFYLPIVVLVFLNYKIFRVANKQRKRTPTVNSENNNPTASGFSNVSRRLRIRRQMKVVKTFAIVLGIFLLCATPCAIVAAIDILFCGYGCVPLSFNLASAMIAGSNSVWNPFVYGIRHKEYRNGFHQLFNYVFRCFT